MGNITAIIVVCSICGFLILILLFLWNRLNKKGSKNKLDEEIKKYKNLNNNQEESQSETKNKKLKKDKQTLKMKKLQGKLLKNIEIDDLQEESTPTPNLNNSSQFTDYDDPFISKERYDFNRDYKNKGKEKEHNQIRDRDKDFEDFLNEYSYTKSLGDKKLIKQIKNLPPKVKALLLGNVFNKFED